MEMKKEEHVQHCICPHCGFEYDLDTDQALREFANECESVRRNFSENGESDKAGAAYHLIFMSGKAEKALLHHALSYLQRGG